MTRRIGQELVGEVFMNRFTSEEIPRSKQRNPQRLPFSFESGR